MRIVCDWSPGAIRAGRAGLLPGLAGRARLRSETSDGYRLTFDASTDTLQAITATIDAERQCCRWLRFDLTVEPAGGPVVLTLSGPERARDFLAALFEL
jgi:hypothetical protein